MFFDRFLDPGFYGVLGRCSKETMGAAHATYLLGIDVFVFFRSVLRDEDRGLEGQAHVVLRLQSESFVKLERVLERDR